MAQLTVQDSTGTVGFVATYAVAASGGDAFINDGKTQLRVKNGGGSSITTTVKSYTLCDQGVEHDLSIAVAAGTEAVVGPLDQGRFNSTAGLASVTYSGVTSVTVAALRVA